MVEPLICGRGVWISLKDMNWPRRENWPEVYELALSLRIDPKCMIRACEMGSNWLPVQLYSVVLMRYLCIICILPCKYPCFSLRLEFSLVLNEPRGPRVKKMLNGVFRTKIIPLSSPVAPLPMKDAMSGSRCLGTCRVVLIPGPSRALVYQFSTRDLYELHARESSFISGLTAGMQKSL